MRLVWAQYALDDREQIFSYIEAENPRAAFHVDVAIESAARRLNEFPESSRTGRVAGTREFVVPRTSYIAAYVILPDRIKILRILHGAPVWPDEDEVMVHDLTNIGETNLAFTTIEFKGSLKPRLMASS